MILFMGTTTAHRILTIEELVSALTYAEQQVAHATAERVAASEREDEWIAETKSLRTLVEIRRKREHPESSRLPNQRTKRRIRQFIKSRF